MNLWGKILKWCGWDVRITAPRRDKCVICVAPHTSNWDFLLGLAAYRSLGRQANFLMKSFWFFWPLGYLMKSFGGIPVRRSKKGESLTQQVIQLFGQKKYVNLAVTPEGTRSRTDKWRTGFLYIAYGAKAPVQLGVIDYKNKLILIEEEIQLTGDVTTDMHNIKRYYENYGNCALYPEKFTSSNQQ